MKRCTPDFYAACLLGGALGDALGWTVEFLDIREIRARHGPGGIPAPEPSAAGIYEITDDTQMTLFTAEGLIRTKIESMVGGISPPPLALHRAYGRWYRTQTGPRPRDDEFAYEDGWLIREPALWNLRAPGNTCMAALAKSRNGTPALNDSKGCGTVMKTAPIGLIPRDSDGRAGSYHMAAEVARLTHGHPTAAVAAGFLSHLISLVRDGLDLKESCAEARLLIKDTRDAGETIGAVDAALRLAGAAGRVGPEEIEELGGGWVAEEAVAIALVAALRAESFEDGVRVAVNHSGDSDSTGAIAGNILGLMLGLKALPKAWLARLEMRETIETVARDLHAIFFTGAYGEAPKQWFAKYPGS
jgi:ADP-ribosyl-[dinitrogen reductase] hydrolase